MDRMDRDDRQKSIDRCDRVDCLDLLQRRNRRECANPADCLDRVDRVGVVDRRSNFSERETCVNPFDGRNGGKLWNSRSAKIRILQDRNSKGPPRVK